jgi:hypothetical protein
MEEHIPKAIPSDIKSLLYESISKAELEKIHSNFYQKLSEHDYFQGNTLESLPFISFTTSKIGVKQAIILSNPCDTDVRNKRSRSLRVAYCRVMSLSGFKKMLNDHSGMTEQEITALEANIKKQFVSDLMYLPSSNHVGIERIAIFSESSSSNMDYLQTKKPILTSILATKAYYLFLTKLSIHYLRFGDLSQPV